MTEALLDPQLEAFYVQNPELLRPVAPAEPDAPWWEEPSVQLAGAVLAVAGLVGLRLASQRPDGGVEALAGQAWNHHMPVWMRFAVPAIKQGYSAGRIATMTEPEAQALAESYADHLGQYVSTTSADALAAGYDQQLLGGWNERLAWQRVTAAYGTDRPQMLSFLRAASARPPDGQSRDVVGIAARMLVDRLLLQRASALGENEIITSSATAQSALWAQQVEDGTLPPDARKRWISHEGACPACLPLNGQEVLVELNYETADGVTFTGPAAHPGCTCRQELILPLEKIQKDMAADPYDRDRKGRFADREYRTRDTAYAEPSPAARQILEELKQVSNPFSSAASDPFAAAADDPFSRAAGDPFSGPGKDPFGIVHDPFAPVVSTTDDPFAYKPKADPAPGRRRIIHHVFMPKKKAGAASPPPAEDPYYLSVHEYNQSFGYPDDQGGYLTQPGDKFPFSDDGALVAVHTRDPWRDIVPSIDERAPGLEDVRHWDAILGAAYPLWSDVMERPETFVDRLSVSDIRHIYNMAGYEPDDEDEFTMRSRIVHSAQAAGIGDDSLAHAYADFVTWVRPEMLGSDGRRLRDMVEDAEMDGAPSLADDGIIEAVVFDAGFHPGTQMPDGHAQPDANYVVKHIIYRSAVAARGTGAPPFVTGLRENYLVPADEEGHPLFGGAYRNPS